MLFKNEANAAATIHDPTIEKAMFDLAAPKRMVGIATWRSAPRTMPPSNR